MKKHFKHWTKRVTSLTAAAAMAMTCAPLLPADAAYARVGVHDPSVVKLDDGSYYIIGSHLAAARSSDLMNWTYTADSNKGTKNTTYFKDIYTDLAKANTWANTSTGYDLSGNLWAPDIVWNEEMNKWCMYLSVNGENWHSSIVLCTADNIDGPYTYVDTIVYSGFETNPANAANSYKNTDVERVLGSNPDLSRYLNSAGRWNAEYGTNAIDPGVFYDEAGNLWMVYGSWFGGIYMLELDEQTGLRDYNVTYPTTSNGGAVQSDAYLGTHVAGGHWVSGEGPYIEYMCPPGSSKGYYYMFLSYGYFNNKGGYNMRVFRSESPAGPYVDMNGNSAIYSAGTDNIAGNIGQRLMSNYQWTCNDRPNTAQGHNSALMDDDGKLYVIYHNKFDDQYGFHEVRVHQLVMNENGWFSAAPYEYSGESLSPNGHTLDAVTGDYELIWHNPNQPFVNEVSADVEKPINITLNRDGTVTGDISATWEMKDGTPYMSFTWGGVTYSGAFIVQNDEAETPVKRMCFTATGINICIWGSKKSEYVLTDDLVSNQTDSKLQYKQKALDADKSVYLGDTSLLADVPYKIESRHSGLALDLAGGKAVDGANIQQWGYASGSAHQEWRICNAQNGYVKILSMVDEDYALTLKDGNIELARYTGADNQLWKLTEKRGSYGITSKSTNDTTGLDVFEWSTESGGNIAEYTYWGGDCQLFNLVPTCPTIPDGDYYIKSVNSGNFLYANTSKTIVQENTPSVWTVQSSGGMIFSNADGAISLNGSAADGTDVILADTGTAFTPYANADGSYTLLANSIEAWDVYGISKDPGANINLWNYWGGEGQKWVFIPAATAEVPTEEPTTEATEPTTEATEPTTEATEPTTEVTEPTTEATEPTTEATEPTTEATEPTTEATEPVSEHPTLYGDTNCDGEVDILDVITLNKYLLGTGELSDAGKRNADVDRSNVMDATDSLNILKCVVEMLTLPV